jgi:hypothetical protein
MRAVRKASGTRATVRATLACTAALALSCAVTAFAGPEMLDVDTPFRARIAKEKIRTAAEERKNEALEKSLGQPQALDQDPSINCGSQNIGNIETSQRPGAATAPREEFVFAPNSINIVGRGACR